MYERWLRIDRSVFILVLICCASPIGRAADEPKKEKEKSKVTFEDHVLPILKARCLKCHAGAEPAGELRLTTRREILRGGQSGPAMRIAAAESSLIWEKLASNAMPKGGPMLTAEEKGIIRSWINDGAASVEATDDDTQELAEQSGQQTIDHWAFLPPVRPSVPTVRNTDRVRNAIDSFILASLEAQGLETSSEASREVLLRRASFDLIGLPPAPNEVREFLADRDELAYERLIDRLLASPHYGERWGRHWLDVAGYAESAGVLSEDRPLPTAFRYRDYVIRAFNSDKPYDRFLQEQVAGDELTDYWTAYESLDRLPDEVVEAVTATGYLRCAPDSSRPDFSTIKNADAQYFYPTINDTLQIVSSSTMGLTLQCARCHSHKFDPIPQVEYFRLQSIFMTAFRPKQWIPQMERRLLVATASQKKAADEHNARLDAEIARLKKEVAGLRAQFKQKLFDDRLAAVPEPIRADVKQALSQPVDQRSAVEKYLAEKFQPLLQPDDKTLDKLLPETFSDYRTGLDQRNSAIAAQEGATGDMLPKQPHHWPRARAVIQLFMHGGPSQVDLLDEKKELSRLSGQAPPAEVADDENRTTHLLGSPFKFSQHGESGLAFSEVLPGIAKHADDIAVIRSMFTEHRNHEQAIWMANKQRGLLDSTLILWGGEFGRTPKIS